MTNVRGTAHNQTMLTVIHTDAGPASFLSVLFVDPAGDEYLVVNTTGLRDYLHTVGCLNKPPEVDQAM